MKTGEFKLSHLNDLMSVIYSKKFVRNKIPNFFSISNTVAELSVLNSSWHWARGILKI